MSDDSNSEFYVPGLMDLSGYSLIRCVADEEWSEFVESSPQGTIFAHPTFLNALNARSVLMYCYKHQHRCAAVLAIESDDGQSLINHDLIIHSGILFAPSDPNQNHSQILSEQFRISCFIIQTLVNKYQNIQLTTHPEFTDIRPFLWHNYGHVDEMFSVDVRYTGFLSLDPPGEIKKLDDSRLYQEANKSRRQDIRYGIKKGVYTEQKFDAGLFSEFYRAMFERLDQDANLDLAEIETLIGALQEAGLLRMYISRVENGTPGSIAIFGVDGKRAYYLYGANNPKMRSDHTGTMVLWDAFRALSQEKVAEVDLEGVNSPARGYFKLSFGAKLKTYYKLTLLQSR